MSEHLGPATKSCHQALAFVLKWQWSKHLAITDIQAPDAIRVFCEKCDACTNARDCNALDVLEYWAREQSEKCKAGEALPPGMSGDGMSSSHQVPTTHRVPPKRLIVCWHDHRHCKPWRRRPACCSPRRIDVVHVVVLRLHVWRVREQRERGGLRTPYVPK